MKYIKDIDGMRALAVLSVVAFHAGIYQLSGGFVGVDVFFVISGFLITSLILNAQDQGRFSLRDFYVRRILRIAPALVMMVLVSTAIFVFLTPPVLSKKLEGSTFSALLSYSNIWFYLTTDYFDNNSDNPLLHTWSLAVEEQFYMVLPLLLILVKSWSIRQRQVLLGVLALVSLLVSEWLVRENRQAAFYLPWARAWELLAGSMLAGVNLANLPQTLRRAAGAAGLAMLVGVILAYDEGVAFPGLRALFPVAASVLLIVSAGAGGPVSSLLSSAPFTFVGKISYSVYLVHWPLVCLTATFLSLQPLPSKVGIFALSLLLGWLSWRYVESPFRKMAGLTSAGKVFGVLGASLAAASVGFLVMQHQASSLWHRFPVAIQYSQTLKTDSSFFKKNGCFLTARTILVNPNLNDQCLAFRSDKPQVLLMGDSHAANLAEALSLYRGQDVNLLQASAVGCRPVNGGAGLPHCVALMDFVFQKWLPIHHGQVQELILAGRWEFADLGKLAETVRKASASGVKKITILGPRPEYYVSVPLILAYEDITGWRLRDRLLKRDRFDLDKTMAATFSSSTSYVSTMDIFCTPVCEVVLRGQPIYFDRNHLTAQGAAYMLSRVPSWAPRSPPSRQEWVP